MKTEKNYNREYNNIPSLDTFLENFTKNLIANKVDFLKISGLLTGLLLLLGGLVFLIYFLSINYMPNLGWESSISILFAGAILGIFLVFSISLMLVFPGIAWIEAIALDDYTRYILSRKDGSLDGYIRLSVSSILMIYIAPYIVSFGFYGPNDIKAGLLFISSGIIVFILALYIPYTIAINGIIKDINTIETLEYKYLVNFQASFLLNKNLIKIELLYLTIKMSFFSAIPTSILILIPVFQIFIAGKENIVAIYDKSWQEFLAVTCFLFCVTIISNKIVTLVCFGQKRVISFLKAFVIGFFVFILISMLFSSLPNMSKNIMQRFGWGNISNTSIILNNEGCLVFEQLDSSLKKSDNSKGCKIDGVDIVLTLGENYVFRYSPRHSSSQKNQNTSNAYNIVLKKTSVISWVRAVN